MFIVFLFSINDYLEVKFLLLIFFINFFKKNREPRNEEFYKNLLFESEIFNCVCYYIRNVLICINKSI